MWDKMETPTIVYDLDTSGGLMEVRLHCPEALIEWNIPLLLML